MSDKEYDFNSGNNKKHHYIGVTKLNALLAKPLSNRDVYNFFKNCFGNFQNEALVEKY